MTTVLNLSDAAAVETISASEVEVIGTADGRQYAHDRQGRELLIGAEIPEWELDNAPGPREVRIERKQRYQDKMMAWPEMRTTRIRATVVEPGSYDRAVERERAREAQAARKANPPYTPVDALAVVPAFAPQLPAFIASPAPENPLLSHSGMVLPGRPAVRGPRAILDYLADKGIRLTPTPDGTGVVVRAKSGRLPPGVREAIRASARLLAGELTANPVACELCNGKDRAAAVTIAEVDVALCEQHATEEQQS